MKPALQSFLVTCSPRPHCTKILFSIKDFFSKFEQICIKLWIYIYFTFTKNIKLLEKCPYTEFFLVRIFLYSLLCKSPYSVWVQDNTDQKKLRIWTFFKQCHRRKTFRNRSKLKDFAANVLLYILRNFLRTVVP